MFQAEIEKERFVLVNCERCNCIIKIPIPRNLTFNSEDPLFPLSYVHKDKNGKRHHCITFLIDQDLTIRRPQISDVIFQG